MYHKNRHQINDHWRFHFEDDAPETVTLPHSWNALDTMEPELASRCRRGTGWYERTIDETAVFQLDGLENGRFLFVQGLNWIGFRECFYFNRPLQVAFIIGYFSWIHIVHQRGRDH